MPPAPSFVLRSAGEALADMADDLPNHEPRRTSQTVVDRLLHIAPGQNIWDVNDDIPAHLRLNVKKTRISSLYKVIDPAKPAYTVTAGGGGGTYMYHWDKRTTTDRERARLQTFPDDFVFKGNPTSVRRQIGMAVPPEGAGIVIGAVLNTLGNVPYKGVASNLLSELDPASVARKRAAKARGLVRREAKRADVRDRNDIEAGSDPLTIHPT